MTQMLLFDSVVSMKTLAGESSPLDTMVSPVDDVLPPTIVIDSRSQPKKRPQREAIDEYQQGMHRMGDLARLVLMRYDLVAQRRAELAEKRAVENGADWT